MRGTNDDGEEFRCYIFYAYSHDVWDYQQIEDEPLVVFPVDKIPGLKTITNLMYLIPYGVAIKQFEEGNNPGFMTLDYY